MEKKSVRFAWEIYDLANTAFSALFITFFFPLLIIGFLGGNEFQLGLAFGISMLFAGVFVPFVGAFSDTIGRRMPFLIFFTVACVISGAIVGFVGLYAALIFGAIANFCYHAALTVYNAILPRVSGKKNIGAVSGAGIGLGYVGTLLSLVMAYAIFSYYGFGTREGLTAIFPAISAFYLGFALITFVLVKDKAVKALHIVKSIKKSFFVLKKSVSNIKSDVFSFLLANLLYNDGMNTAILFLYLYGREQIGLSIMNFMYVYAIFAISAAVGGYLFGKIVDKIGAKKSLNIALVMWIGVVLMLMTVKNIEMFIVSGIFGGIAMAAVWTANRPMLVKLAPKKQIGEFFGFLELVGKFSGVLGPIVFGYLVVHYSYQYGLVSLLVFFCAGLVILQKVKK